MNRQVDLGHVLIVVDHRAVGVSAKLVLDIPFSTPEDFTSLLTAKNILIVRPTEATPPEEMTPEKHSPVPVPFERLNERLKATAERDYVMPLKGSQVVILQGLVALAADHPGIKDLHDETQRDIRHFRDWCKAVFIDMGFSPGEAVYIDTMREDIQGKITAEGEDKE